MSDTPPMAAATPLRDSTPELTAKREKRHREDDDDDRDRTRSSHRHEERSRRHNPEDESDEEREERRRRRRERELRDREDDSRRHHREREPRSERSDRDRDRERDYERSERSERSDRNDRDYRDRDRDRERERDRDRRHRDDDRREARDGRDRDSRDSRDRRRPSRSPPRVRDMTREEKERERERRDREMMEERREAARGQRRRSPSRDPVDQYNNVVDAEQRTIFVSQIAARLTSSDLGLFFEDKLGRGSVRDARVITDKGRRSKGIGYVELATVDLVNKALAMSGTVVMGIPMQIGLTDADKNREGIDLKSLLASMRNDRTGRRDGGDRRDRRPRFPPLSIGLQLPPGLDPEAHSGASIPYHRVYITNLSDSLNKEDLRQVFEPFGDIEFVDLHTDVTGNSRGTAYVQFRELASAQMALDAMHGFELAGRTIRATAVEERQAGIEDVIADGGRGGGGGRLDAAGRRELMYKLARTEMPGTAASRPAPVAPKPSLMRPTHFLQVGNMFNPDEETERNWDLDLAEDVKGEVESKYGHVARVKVDKMSQGDVYIEFMDIDSAERAQRGLGGRFFGGRQLEAQYISETLFKAHL